MKLTDLIKLTPDEANAKGGVLIADPVMVDCKGDEKKYRKKKCIKLIKQAHSFDCLKKWTVDDWEKPNFRYSVLHMLTVNTSDSGKRTVAKELMKYLPDSRNLIISEVLFRKDDVLLVIRKKDKQWFYSFSKDMIEDIPKYE